MHAPNPAPARPALLTPLALALALAVWLALVYAQTASFDFITYDDNEYLTMNQTVQQGLSLEGAAWALGVHAGNWHPLTWLAHMANVSLFGLNPAGHHLVNLGLHILASLMFFALARAATDRVFPAFFAAALFGLHPLRVEAVAWTAELKELLAACFFLGALIAWQWRARRPSPGRYLASLGLAAGALMSKPMAVSLPLVLLVWDFWPLGRFKGRAWRNFWALVLEKTPFFALAALAGLATLHAQTAGGALKTLAEHPLGARLAMVAFCYPAYILKTLFPVNLAVFYPFPDGGLVWRGLVGVLTLAGLIWLATRLRRRAPAVSAGLAWFMITLVPVSGLVQVGAQALADRYTYLPGLGLSLALVWGAMALGGRLGPRPRVLGVWALAALLILGVLSHRQAGFWLNTETLFTHALEVTRQNHIAHENLGAFFALTKRPEKALYHYQKALEIAPNRAGTYYNLGQVHLSRQEAPQGEAAFARALRLNPGLVRARYWLAATQAGMGRLGLAEENYRAVLKLQPENTSALHGLGVVLARQGHFQAARAMFEKTLALAPDHAQAAHNLKKVKGMLTPP